MKDSTRVDLGDDLLAETVPDSARAADEGEVLLPSGVGPEERMRNAGILLNEGFIEDAKRVLRKLLIEDPRFVPARDKLAEIHEIELKQILSPRESTGFLDRRKKSEPWVAPEEVLRKLDEDLGLGLEEDPLPSIFPDRESVRGFAASVEASLRGTSPRDRMDIGIAFLEMNLPEAAIPQFQAAATDEGLKIGAASLLACALLAARRPLDAVMILEPWVNDSEIEGAGKAELLYMMGRAQEALGKREEALNRYRQAQAIDNQYRDSGDRIRRLGTRTVK